MDFGAKINAAPSPSRVNLVVVSYYGKTWRKLREGVVVDVHVAQLAAVPLSPSDLMPVAAAEDN